MALTAAQRKANQRAREQGKPEPFGKATMEQCAERDGQHEVDLVWAQKQDASGKFYKSECRSCVTLLGIYEGGGLHQEETDEETSNSKKKKSKQVIPNPSVAKIVIPATEWNGIPIDPVSDDDSDGKREVVYEVNEIASFQRWLDIRAKARRDLFWLGRLLGYGLYAGSHQYVCDQFVKKNFEGMYFPGYTLDQFHAMMKKQVRYANYGTDVILGTSQTREMVLLEPRSSYKSTINRIDTVQWLINCPDIRIMFITAFKELALEFAADIKMANFYLSPQGTPTAFQLLFPEYILTGVDGTSEQPMDCPARNLHQPQPSVWATSMESSSTGKHCDICKFDDAVDPKNSADDEMRAKLKFKINGYDDVRDPWGFTDFCGTVYFTNDWYGTRLLPEDEDSKEVAPLLYSRRGSWELSAEDFAAYCRPESDPTRLTVREIIQQRKAKLVHPYKLTWKELDKILKKKGLRSFKNQQLNEATDPKSITNFINQFKKEILEAHCYPRESAPKVGDIWQVWDTAYGEKATSDFSCGVTGMVYQRADGKYALCVLEIVFGKWRSSELPTQIALFYRRWPAAKRVLIEKSNGSEWLISILGPTAAKYNVPDMSGKIYAFDIDTSANAKRNRIKSLELLLADDRLHFVNGSWLDETFKQLVSFTGEKSTTSRKDDIPDALSFFFKILPRDVVDLQAFQDTKANAMEREREDKKEALKQHHKRMFGDAAFPQNTLASQFNNRNQPPPETPQPEGKPDPRRAMFNRVFGGNGMRA